MNEMLTMVFAAAALLAGGITMFSLAAIVRGELAQSRRPDFYLATVAARSDEVRR